MARPARASRPGGDDEEGCIVFGLFIRQRAIRLENKTEEVATADHKYGGRGGAGELEACILTLKEATRSRSRATRERSPSVAQKMQAQGEGGDSLRFTRIILLVVVHIGSHTVVAYSRLVLCRRNTVPGTDSRAACQGLCSAEGGRDDPLSAAGSARLSLLRGSSPPPPPRTRMHTYSPRDGDEMRVSCAGASAAPTATAC